jgi:O-acetyl-ADP-ribose deacetylase
MERFIALPAPSFWKNAGLSTAVRPEKPRSPKAIDFRPNGVIHTVGPVWHGGKSNEDELLARCYRNSLTLAEKHAIRKIAFPCISTGVYRFPSERAARIALREIKRFLDGNKTVEKVLTICFGKTVFEIYQQAVTEISK